MFVKHSKCPIKIKLGEEYNYHLEILCEGCYMVARDSRVRKTHWQYIRSKKAEFLIPGKEE